MNELEIKIPHSIYRDILLALHYAKVYGQFEKLSQLAFIEDTYNRTMNDKIMREKSEVK